MAVMRTTVAAVTLMASAAAQQTPAPAKKSALDKAAMEAYVRHLFVYGPQIKVEVEDPKPSPLAGFQEVVVRASAGQASEVRQFYVSGDGLKILQATVWDINASPFERDLKLLKTDLSPSFGTPGAPVVIVVFSDFQCQYCRQEGKMLREQLLKAYPTQVRVYFKDMPLQQIHPWAMTAAIAGRCVFRQKAVAFWDYHDYIFEQQPNINEGNLKAKIGEFAGSKGLDQVRLTSCIEAKLTAPEVEKSMAEARTLGVNSTPTLYINGRKIAFSIAWENLKQIIDFELNYQKSAQNAGEQCCTVKLASPLDPK